MYNNLTRGIGMRKGIIMNPNMEDMNRFIKRRELESEMLKLASERLKKEVEEDFRSEMLNISSDDFYEDIGPSAHD